ncbi:RNA polymerase sporulation specific sigma factor SigH [Lachnospiraceae bacterium KM106-2]|nr:RNA polymerase sporulation specific sigma factor SigH [Lachnospiraceae bacterium KM106-2]
MHFLDYGSYSDEQLLQMAKEDDRQAVDCLMERYKYLVRQKAHALFLIGGEEDDLIQEGMIGLYKALHDFKSDRNASFYHFASLCISRQIFSALKLNNRKKNYPLNTYISFYTPIGEESHSIGEDISLVDVMFPKSEQNPEELIIDQENTRRLKEELDKKLSEFERKVILFYVKGYSYTKIAEMMKKSPKSIDNALQRIRVKVNRIVMDLER